VSLHDDETDPTGMRELLRGLPHPGPMPDDLVARIRSSLADLPAPEPADTADEAPPVVSRGTSPGADPARPSWWARNGPRAAVAAAVLIGGGAVASGQLGLLASGGDSASTSADSSVGGRAESGAGSDEGAAGPQTADRDASARQAEPGPVVVTMSDRRYTSSSFGTEVSSAAGSTPTGPLTAEAPGIGPIGTEIGVRSCLVALGLPEETGARVDLALLDEQPAAVVVVTGGGGRTAYAVGRDCTIGNPSLLAGPVDLP